MSSEEDVASVVDLPATSITTATTILDNNPFNADDDDNDDEKEGASESVLPGTPLTRTSTAPAVLGLLEDDDHDEAGEGGNVIITDTAAQPSSPLSTTNKGTQRKEPVFNEEGGVSFLADTASASSGVNEDGTLDSQDNNDDDDDDDDDDDEENEEDDDPMPLINYSRLRGSIPRQRRAPVVAAATPTVTSTSSGTTLSAGGALSVPCTCSAVAKVVLDPTATTTSADGGVGSTGMSAGLDMTSTIRTMTTASSSKWGGGVGTPTLVDSQRPELLLSSDLWKQPHYVMAMGFGTGDVSVVNVQTGITVLQPEQPIPASSSSSSSTQPLLSQSQQSPQQPSQHPRLKVREAVSVGIVAGFSGTNPPPLPPPIVDVKFDASGTFLGAVDAGGACAIWELKYAPSIRPTAVLLLPEEEEEPSPSTISTLTSPTAQLPPPPHAASTTIATTTTSGNMFSSFMSAFTGTAPPSNNAAPKTSSTPAISSSPSSSSTGTNTSPIRAGVAGSPSRASNPATTTSTSNNNDYNNQWTPTLAATMVQVSRITYPASFGTPACLALDPALKRRREKSILVGFADGRLVLTKRGFFQRRTDSILYQGAAKLDEKNYRGIEAIAWRGSLIAWADASGIKLMDADTLTRIAHIDRPTGARPTLYPTISSLRPSLFFERSNSLLVAWGDCLMSMGIREVTTVPVGSAMTGLDAGGASQTIVKRRTVECTMAWELDCVACGVAPLDDDNVVVLGLVPPLDDDEEEVDDIVVVHDNDEGEQNKIGGGNGASIHHGGNDLEMQILSRKDGTIVYSDSLPMLKSRLQNQQPQQQTPGGIMAESASSYTLLSSFALPRMDDAAEAEEASLTGQTLEQDFDLNVSSIFSPASEIGKRPFRDVHLEWDLKSIMFQEDKRSKPAQSEDPISRWHDKKDHTDNGDDDAHSVDSDDYDFIIKALPESELLQHTITIGPAPIMVVTSGSDVILSRMGDVDDAVAHALSRNKRGLALRRALRHKRQLRRYELSDLVSSYLQALLRLRQKTAALLEEDKEDEGKEEDDPLPSLSLRRTKLAVQSMPVLLGGDVALWQRWAQELEGIPGALFLLRDHLPVRDPILPPRLFERALETMLQEAQQISQTPATGAEIEPPTSPVKMALEAQDHFLNSLVAWGPTKVLKEYIKLLKNIRERRPDDASVEDSLKTVEIFLQRRYLQTAAGYLNFPVHFPTTTTDLEGDTRASVPRFEANSDDSQDSLFDHSVLLKILVPRAPLASIVGDLWNNNENRLDPSSLSPDNRMCLDAIARLQMMDDRYDLALRCFLAIGAFHSPQSFEAFEAAAIEEVNNSSAAERKRKQAPMLIESSSYEFVLGLIESHHLHQFLLNKDYLANTDSKLFMPLFALLRLVGLDLMGDFLIEHCVSPEIVSPAEAKARSSGLADDDLDDNVRRETLPIDQVADQLEQSPALLHWYLHKVFTRKPEIYVKFPYTANPPKAVTGLHRRHFNLCVQFAGADRDSAKSLYGTEAYKVETVTTPLLSFLKEALPLGGIRPVDARRLLEAHRSQVDDSDDENDEVAKSPIDRSNDFSLELAFIIEHYSDETEAEARGILDLYLEGANSVVLAVSYAQRQQSYSSILWDKLISYCLTNDASKSKMKGTKAGRNGLLFGSLLQAAALSGADLARLVEKIPPGMVVEGLRPRLVAAVADYRFKLDIHEAAATASGTDRNELLREVTHRSRRGVRYQKLALPDPKSAAVKIKRQDAEISEEPPQRSFVPKSLRTVERRNRHRLAHSLPMR